MKKLFLFILILLTKLTSGQFGQSHIITDSSNIEITENVNYTICEETYRHKDSVHYTIRYSNDSTLYKEGWCNKRFLEIGKWNTFSPQGIWLNAINYNSGTWVYNKGMYPFQPLLDSMKLKADSILQAIYGEDFFRHNILFKFSGYTYIGGYENSQNEKIWVQKKIIGNWEDPILERPNAFVLNYGFFLDEQHFYPDKISVSLDSLGNIQKPNCEIDFNHQKKSKNSAFSLTYNEALQICRQNGLTNSDSSNVEAGLRCPLIIDNNSDGIFYFEVRQRYDHKTLAISNTTSKLIEYYNVWRIDPWTSELILHKKMKIESQLKGGCLLKGVLVDLDE